jgi:2-(1,2-epoxy-1,2-dihydrophenyl)acetyl-CoA isomerase
MDTSILARSAGGVGRLTLNRPDQRNAITPDMMVLLCAKLREMDADPHIRCIVLDGAGEHFVAGGDIKAWSRLLPMTPRERGDDFKTRFDQVLPLIEALDSVSKPLIVAVKGYSAGAGLCFVLAADFVIADATAKFLFANIRVGLNPDLGLTYWLPRLVGERQALRLTLLGSQLDAQEAKNIGLIDEVAPEGEIEAAVDHLTKKLLAMPVRAAAETKRLMHLSRTNTLTAQFQAEADGIAACAGESDFVEAVTAFSERRAPRFGGSS